MKLSARFLVVADNHEVLQAHFFKKVLELPSLTPSVKYCTQPNASSVKYILLYSYAVSLGQNLVKYIYSFSSIFTAVERIPRDKQGGVAA